MSTLYVIRHAQASMFAANYDVLSERGRDQARRLGVVLGERFAAGDHPGFDAVLGGPATRHLDTAKLAAGGLLAAGRRCPEPRILAGFDEHDGQAMVRAALTELARRDGGLAARPGLAKLAAQASDATLELSARARAWHLLFQTVMALWLDDALELEGVERWPAFRARVVDAFAELRDTARGEVALFTSVGPTAVLLAEVLALPPATAFAQAWRLFNTSITRIVYSGPRMTLDGFNEAAHLPLGLCTRS